MPGTDYSNLSRAQLLEVIRELNGILSERRRQPFVRPEAFGPSKLETALSEQEARRGAPQRVVAHPQLLAAIVEASADAMTSRTLDGTLLTWNKGAEKVYGYAAGEAIGRNYLMLFPETSEAEVSDLNAATIARKMLSLFAGEYIVAGVKLLITSSLGVSIYPDHGRDPGLLIRLADKAMYDAKQAGRNGYRLCPQKAN